MKKKIFASVCAAIICAVSVCAVSGCNSGGAQVNYTLSESGTHYIVSGVSGNADALTEYTVPTTFTGEDGQALPVTEIGEAAFMQCSYLSTVTLHSGVTKIGDRAFVMSGLSQITMPEGLKEIGDAAFGMCSRLRSITLPKSVEELGTRAFAYCTKLEKAYVKSDITVLREKVFYNSVPEHSGEIYTNTSLTEIYLPATLQKIAKDALFGNYVTDIYFAGTEEQWAQVYFYENVLKEGSESEYEEKRIEKSELIKPAVNVHLNVEF